MARLAAQEERERIQRLAYKLNEFDFRSLDGRIIEQVAQILGI